MRGYVNEIKIPNNFLFITSNVPRHTITFVEIKELVNIEDYVQTPYKDVRPLSDQQGHHPFPLRILASLYTCGCPSIHHKFCSSATSVGLSGRGAGATSEKVGSLGQAFFSQSPYQVSL